MCERPVVTCGEDHLLRPTQFLLAVAPLEIAVPDI